MEKQIEELLEIAKFFQKQGYLKTASEITLLVKILTRRKQVPRFEEFAEKAASITSIFQSEFAGTLQFGQDYREKCFEQVSVILYQSIKGLGEDSEALLTQFRYFMNRKNEIDKNLMPMSELFSSLWKKPNRSAEESLVMFHIACYIYLVGMEGIFDELVKLLYILAQAAKGNIIPFEEVKVEKLWDIRTAYKQLFGISPVFLERLDYKTNIRNAIAHAQAQYNIETNRIRFRSIDTKNRREVFNKVISFDEFQALHMEILDAIDSFRYSLLLMRVQESLVDCYKHPTAS
jgi:hypothetical protein